MKWKFLTTIFAITIIVSGCVKEDNLIVDQSKDTAAYKKLRPFKGNLISFPSDSSELACDCGEIEPLFISGTGNASHMGRISSDGVSCAEPLPNGFSIDGCVSLVAANGDKIFTDVDPYDLLIDMECFCRLTGETYATITGGTGRFTNASGFIDIVVELNIETNEFKVDFTGGIDY
jgi:hypothetical protein